MQEHTVQLTAQGLRLTGLMPCDGLAAVFAPSNSAYMEAQQLGLLPRLPLGNSTSLDVRLLTAARAELQQFLQTSLVPGRFTVQTLPSQAMLTTVANTSLPVVSAEGVRYRWPRCPS